MPRPGGKDFGLAICDSDPTCTQLHGNCAHPSICIRVLFTGPLLCLKRLLEITLNLQHICSVKCMRKFSVTIINTLQYSNASVKHQNSTAYNFTSLLGAISEKYFSIFYSTYTRDHIYRCWPLVSINLSRPIFILP